MSKKALIMGVSGQDGTYLAQLLVAKGYEVVGTSRDAEMAGFGNLERFGLRDKVRVESAAVSDFRSVLQVIAKIEPDEIYNLSGQSSVGLSFHQPVETLESINLATLNILEAIRFLGRPVRLYNASSTECFGHTGDAVADEQTPFRPRSPYAVAKSAAFWLTANYREAYGLFACSGILSNHESPIRPMRFVTRKIAAAAARIARGSQETLALGNLAIRRDWGWAPEYVEAMWLMLQQREPTDLVISTGSTHSLQDFVSTTFAHVGLDWTAHVQRSAALARPSDLETVRTNPAMAAATLGWRAQTTMPGVARMMVEAELQALRHPVSASSS